MTETVIATFVSLAGLWVLVFWLYRDYRVDLFRQELFQVRDELFDFAAQGQIPFDHPAYVGLREVFNGYIRFAHRVGILPAALFSRSLTDEERVTCEQLSLHGWWDSELDGLAVPVARRLSDLRDRGEELLERHLILGSPLLTSTVIPAVVLIVVVWLPVAAVKSAWRNILESVEVAARELGQVA